MNIAQFHPIPGSGIVYGTKRGKVKVFHRNNYEFEKRLKFEANNKII